PAIDATLITRPQPRSSMPASTWRVSRNGPVTFTLRCRCHDARSVLASGAASAMPELLTRTSIGPSACSLSATARAMVAASVAVAARAPAHVGTGATPGDRDEDNGEHEEGSGVHGAILASVRV